jgi:hypothetical protein
MRIGYLISGVIATFLALGVLLVGGGLVLIDNEKDSDGYLTTNTKEFSTDTSALASENIDLDLDEAGWLVSAEDFGKVRVRVDSAGEKPVFVGVARTADAERYLDGVAHSTVTDFEADPFKATYKDHFGNRKPAKPAASSIWEASSTGSGKQDLVWDVDDGDWSVVVMNADGSPGVATSVSAGAKLPELGAIGWSTMGGGALLLGLGVTLTIISTRPKKPSAPRAAAAAPVAV